MLPLTAVLRGLARPPPSPPAQPDRSAADASSGADTSAGGIALHAPQPPPAGEGVGSAGDAEGTQGPASGASAAATAGSTDGQGPTRAHFVVALQMMAGRLPVRRLALAVFEHCEKVNHALGAIMDAGHSARHAAKQAAGTPPQRELQVCSPLRDLGTAQQRVASILSQALDAITVAAREPARDAEALAALPALQQQLSRELAHAGNLAKEFFASCAAVVASSRSPGGIPEGLSALMSQEESQHGFWAMARAPAKPAAPGSSPGAVASQSACDADAAASGGAGAEGVGMGAVAEAAGGASADAAGSSDAAEALDSTSAQAAGCGDALAAPESASAGAADSGDAAAAPDKASAEDAGSHDAAAAQGEASTEAAAPGACDSQQGVQGARGDHANAGEVAPMAPRHVDGATAQAAVASIEVKGHPAQAAAATQTGEEPVPSAAAQSVAGGGSGAAAADQGDAGVQAAPAAVKAGNQPAQVSSSAQTDEAPATGAPAAGPGSSAMSACSADQSGGGPQATADPMRAGQSGAAVEQVSGIAKASIATQTEGGDPKDADTAMHSAAQVNGSASTVTGLPAQGNKPRKGLLEADLRFDFALATLAAPWPAVLGGRLQPVHRAGALARHANVHQLQKLVQRTPALAPDTAKPQSPDGATSCSRSAQLIAKRIREVCGARPLDAGASWRMPSPAANPDPVPEHKAADAGHMAPTDVAVVGDTAAPATPDAVKEAMSTGMKAIRACQVQTHCFQARLARALDRLAAPGCGTAAGGGQVSAPGSGHGAAAAAGAGAPQGGTAEANRTPVAAASFSDPLSVLAGGVSKKKRAAARKAARSAGGGGGGGASAALNGDAGLLAAGATASEGAGASAPAARVDSAAASGEALHPARTAARPEADAGVSSRGAPASGPASGGQAVGAAQEPVPVAAAASSHTGAGPGAGEPGGGPVPCGAPADRAQETACVGDSVVEVDVVSGSQRAGAQEPVLGAGVGAGASTAAGELSSAPPAAEEAASAAGDVVDAASQPSCSQVAAAAQGLGRPAKGSGDGAEAAAALDEAAGEVLPGSRASVAVHEAPMAAVTHAGGDPEPGRVVSGGQGAAAAEVPVSAAAASSDADEAGLAPPPAGQPALSGQEVAAAQEPAPCPAAACAPAEAGAAAGDPASATVGASAPGEPAPAAGCKSAAAGAAAAGAAAAEPVGRNAGPGGEPADSAGPAAACAGPVGSGVVAVAAGAAESSAALGSGVGSAAAVAGDAAAGARGHDASSAGRAAGLAAAQAVGSSPAPRSDPGLPGVPKHELLDDIEALYAHTGQEHPWQGLREDLQGELRRGHREAREAEGWLADAWLGTLQPKQCAAGIYQVRCCAVHAARSHLVLLGKTLLCGHQDPARDFGMRTKPKVARSSPWAAAAMVVSFSWTACAGSAQCHFHRREVRPAERCAPGRPHSATCVGRTSRRRWAPPLPACTAWTGLRTTPAHSSLWRPGRASAARPKAAVRTASSTTSRRAGATRQWQRSGLSRVWLLWRSAMQINVSINPRLSGCRIWARLHPWAPNMRMPNKHVLGDQSSAAVFCGAV